MKYTVYILYSSNFKKIYIGYTSNLEERIKSHNELSHKGWTIKYRPWTLVFTEEFDTKQEAMSREKALKGAKGRVFIWDIIKSKGLISA